MMLDVETFPGQVPYRSILPQGLDNLLVPVCLSCTHVAWGTVRLEPTWMNLAESAGFAAALAIGNGLPPARLDPDELLKKLVSNHVMVSFFNDLDVSSDDPQIAAAQYFATKGFFATYDARLDEAVTEALATVWREGFKKLRGGQLDPLAMARTVAECESTPSGLTAETRGEFLRSLFTQP